MLTAQHETFVLCSFDRDNRPLTTREISLPGSAMGLSPTDFQERGVPVPMIVRSDRVYIGLHNHLVIVNRTGELDSVEQQDAILQLHSSAPYTRLRVVLSFKHGGTMYWDDVGGGHFENFAGDMSQPRTLLTRGGWLIAAADGVCRVHRTADSHVHIRGEIYTDLEDPEALITTPHKDQFAWLTRDGELVVYQVSVG
jgi:hypothetical protein